MDQAAGTSAQERQWAMFLHFSLLAGFVIPFGGLIAPIVIWQLKKAEFPSLDVHGKVVVNWIISVCIYGAVFAVLSLVLIGIPLLIALGIASVCYAIIGGIKANEGTVWKYPGSLTLLK